MEKESTIIHSSLRTVEWKNNKVVMIDQTKLPSELVYVELTDYNQVANAIKTLVVRGAPAIGIAGAYGLVIALRDKFHLDRNEFMQEIKKQAD